MSEWATTVASTIPTWHERKAASGRRIALATRDAANVPTARPRR